MSARVHIATDDEIVPRFSVVPRALAKTRTPVEDHGMHVELATALIVVALVASVMLVVNRGDRVFPVLGFIAAGLGALIHFNIIALSSGKFRIDVILPAVLTLAGAVCWARATTKSAITAAALLLAAGLVLLLGAVHVVG